MHQHALQTVDRQRSAELQLLNCPARNNTARPAMNIPTIPVHQTEYLDPGVRTSSDPGDPADLSTQLPDPVLDPPDQAVASAHHESTSPIDLTSDNLRLPLATGTGYAGWQSCLYREAGRGEHPVKKLIPWALSASREFQVLGQEPC